MKLSIQETKDFLFELRNPLVNGNMYIERRSAEKVAKRVKGLFSGRAHLLSTFSPLKDLPDPRNYLEVMTRVILRMGGVEKPLYDSIVRLVDKTPNFKVGFTYLAQCAKNKVDPWYKILSEERIIEGNSLIFIFVVKEI